MSVVEQQFQVIVSDHNILDTDILISNDEKFSFKKNNFIFTIIYLTGRKNPYSLQWEDSDGEIWSIQGSVSSQEEISTIIGMILDNKSKSLI